MASGSGLLDTTSGSSLPKRIENNAFAYFYNFIKLYNASVAMSGSSPRRTHAPKRTHTLNARTRARARARHFGRSKAVFVIRAKPNQCTPQSRGDAVEATRAGPPFLTSCEQNDQ